MALTVSSPRVFNGNVGKQAYGSTESTSGSKCICCPYGYHIDLDFVEYCEAVAAGNIDKNTIERRKKRERRRQCQSMEILLGLVSPTFSELENELSKISQQDEGVSNGVTTLPRSGHQTSRPGGNNPHPYHHQHSTALDLSDVVGDFEATLQRLSKPYKNYDRRNQSETDGAAIGHAIQHTIHADHTTDFDASSVGSGNSNLSAGALQNIREQMAMSLERMRELEDQVKAIPMLQAQMIVLKEEKKKLEKTVDNFKQDNLLKDIVNSKIQNQLRSNSFSSEKLPQKCVAVNTRDMGTMCGVMTRDVGVSHQQVRTRDVGMTTSTPIQVIGRPTEFTTVKLDDLDFEPRKAFGSPTARRSLKKYQSRENITSIYSNKDSSSLSNLSRSSESNSTPEMKRKNSLSKIPSYQNLSSPKELKDSWTNTESARLTRSDLFFEQISPEIIKDPEVRKTRSSATETTVKMSNLYTSEEVARMVEEAVSRYRNSMTKQMATKGIQCLKILPKKLAMRHKETQTSEPFKMRSHVGVTVKPRTSEIGTSIGPSSPGTKSIAIGPDPVSIVQPISLNSMNSRSHSFNYGDTKPKRKTTRTVGLSVEGLIKTTPKSTDTVGLSPKRREFGTSPIKKKLVDVSVGASVKPHISISCAANYCDNCKETIKTLAKQISNNNENMYRSLDNSPNQATNGVSRIPRPANINLNTTDLKKQFKRQDTYTKIPVGIIRYDADNKESYDCNKHEMVGEEIKNDTTKESKEIISPEKEINSEEKTSLPDSALFEPIRDKSRVKKEPSKEMRAALKVLNDNLKKSPSKNISHQTKNATNVIQQEWFKISSVVTANPLDVEDYLDCFEEHSSILLEYIVNMVDTNGNTAMHYAVSHGNYDVVSILLDSKVCDINKPNAAGYTPVMLTALVDIKNSTHASVITRLFQLADVNTRAKIHGQTALMLAVSHGRTDMTRLLLDAGAAVNIQDEDGSSALMCAAEHGHADIVKLLLANSDCDTSIVDVDGNTALTIAVHAGNRDIGMLLYAHEQVSRGTSPYSSMRRSRRGSKPTTPTGPSPSAPASPAPSRRFTPTSKYSGK
ncbi:KN motif and ankyrin repeat domain-containing protein 2-like [Cotesia glomerata]|uniref:KN motif and ankyrin repeat domain-containing protein 2-like n=1 Tax=Cotesia glomerata TaxID=32391 RepID=UPI001D0260F5|nr:KN motif and ankyrin repeat domain-containing protein 2-like [Cotesia glomerata]XP_044589205.1 KN motif and ankyrin repeat domain-containing protein 2-like [Cotesia glomerata]